MTIIEEEDSGDDDGNDVVVLAMLTLPFADRRSKSKVSVSKE